MMLNTILGEKNKMGQAFVEGTRVPVTTIKVGPCTVTQVKEEDKNGYWAVQIGFGIRNLKNTSKPVQGHLRGVIKDKKAPRFLREVRLNTKEDYKVGDVLQVSDVLKAGDVVEVVGVSKGKGFAGGVKRWGFAGGPKTHGQSDRLRAPGSIGQGTTPGRVYKGKKMAGRMGSDRVTVRNLTVVEVKDDLVKVSGPVPGKTGNLLIIRKVASGKLTDLVEEVKEEVAQSEEGPEVKEPEKE